MSTAQLQLMTPTMQKWGNSDRSILEMAMKLSEGRLLLPLHQRTADAWNPSRKRNWVNRIRMGRPSVGVLITYQLYDSDGASYLNDGLQRTSAVIEYLHDPAIYGDDLERAKSYCDQYEITVQHRHYSSHDEALVDFQEINLGTKLTPYEFCHGVLTYMPSYDALWRSWFDDLHSTISNQSARILVRSRGDNREGRQIAKRNDLALFYRFAIDDKTRRRYWSPKRRVDVVEVREKQVIEWLLRQHLESIGISKAREKLQTFCGLIERETALLETLWYASNQQGTGISNSLFRFLLDVAIWRRNSGIPYKYFEEFSRLLIERSGGSGKLQHPDNPRRHFTCSMDGLNSLRTACDMLGYHLILDPPVNQPVIQVKPGYDKGHVQPKALFGNGLTVPQPGGVNRSNGARSVVE